MTNQTALEHEVKIACVEIGYLFDEGILDLLIPQMELEEGIWGNELIDQKSIKIIKEIVQEWKENTIKNFM